jgi:uncharacterized membrane protein
MSDRIVFVLTLVSALGCGLAAGAFFAFSTFVMRALARLPAAQGIAAMQSINVAAINPFFMLLLFGTAQTCLVLAAWSLFTWDMPAAGLLFAGGLLYVLGTAGVTIAFNVPLNNALGAVDPSSADGAALWGRFVKRWTAWNHVRTAAALVAAALLTLALRGSRPGMSPGYSADHARQIRLHVQRRLLHAPLPVVAELPGVLLVLVRVQDAPARGDQRALAVAEGGTRHVRRRALGAVARQQEERLRQPLAQAHHRLRLRRADDRADRAEAARSDQAFLRGDGA